jgi:hypothetical protein
MRGVFGEGKMEGKGAKTMDGETRTEDACEPARGARQAAPGRRNTSVDGRIGELRVRLIAATVEVLAAGRSPRLSETVTTLSAA